MFAGAKKSYETNPFFRAAFHTVIAKFVNVSMVCLAYFTHGMPEGTGIAIALAGVDVLVPGIIYGLRKILLPFDRTLGISHIVISTPLVFSMGIYSYPHHQYLVTFLFYATVFGFMSGSYPLHIATTLSYTGVYLSILVYDVYLGRSIQFANEISLLGSVLFLNIFSAVLIRESRLRNDRLRLITRENIRQKVQIERAREELLELDKQKTTFFERISHELRTPLTLIIGPVQYALQNGRTLEADSSETLLLNARRLLRLVNQLLDMQKITAGRMQPERVGISLTPFLGKICDAFAPYAETKSIQLMRDIDSRLPPVLADADHIDKCVYNYLSNALKYSPENSTILLRAIRSNGGVAIEVKDSGPGIQKDEMHHLFQRFSRIEGSFDQEGTGLGLSIVKELIELHQGTVSVESEPGKGSLFRFWLPTAPPGTVPAQMKWRDERAAIELSSATSTRRIQKQSGPQRELVGGELIVVAEDHQDLRSHLHQILSDAGYQVALAPDGLSALQQLERLKPDLLITDLMLPVISGNELIARLRQIESCKTLPVMMLTAKADVETRRDLHRVGADAFLAKPFDHTELLSMIKNLLLLKERESTLLQELRMARTVQQSLLPQSLPGLKGLSVGARYLPMNLVGGDMYDFMEFPGGRLGVFVADVSGHGVPAALIASMAKLLFTVLAPRTGSPSELLNQMNQLLLGKTCGNFVTCSYIMIDPANKKLICANAGHPPLLILRGDKIQQHRPQGTAIGFYEDADFAETIVDIESGDRLLIYTDGLTDARDTDGVPFDDVRLFESFKKSADFSAEKQVDAIVLALDRHRKNVSLPDDITLVSIHVS